MSNATTDLWTTERGCTGRLRTRRTSPIPNGAKGPKGMIVRQRSIEAARNAERGRCVEGNGGVEGICTFLVISMPLAKDCLEVLVTNITTRLRVIARKVSGDAKSHVLTLASEIPVPGRRSSP